MLSRVAHKSRQLTHFISHYMDRDTVKVVEGKDKVTVTWIGLRHWPDTLSHLFTKKMTICADLKMMIFWV